MSSSLDAKLSKTADALRNEQREILSRPCATDLVLPDKDVAIRILRDLRKLLFPGYFGSERVRHAASQDHVLGRLERIASNLLTQVEVAFVFEHCRLGGDMQSRCAQGFVDEATAVVDAFLTFIPQLRDTIIKDIEATYLGDPAAKSREEVIFSYPGTFATFVYRVAHELYVHGVPFLPRMMTEYAHSRTGIDISAGATIGDYFMIDHGTGVVIGETTVIGKHCKIYQGVTLGAASTRDGQDLAGVKRHPTVEDDVTIYANATILGGDTVIGRGATIGGNAFITSSVKAGLTVSGR